MINIYSSEEIDKIRESGKITAQVLRKVLQKVGPGITTEELDHYANDLIEQAGGKASFKMVPGYHWATCQNVNDMVVHGIPSKYHLQVGDRLGVDLGTYYKGFHSDASWSTVVKSPIQESETERIKSFLTTGEKALNLAIEKCAVGNHIGDISKAIQDTVESGGYSPVKQLVGHGVGRNLHEDPEIPCYVRGKIKNTPEIKVGMVLAIEVIYSLGRSEVVYANDDGWTVVSRDGSVSGLFEHTVAVTDHGPEILTI